MEDKVAEQQIEPVDGETYTARVRSDALHYKDNSDQFGVCGAIEELGGRLRLVITDTEDHLSYARTAGVKGIKVVYRVNRDHPFCHEGNFVLESIEPRRVTEAPSHP